MLKCRVFDKSEISPELYLKLVPYGNEVFLTAVDQHGRILSHICGIREDGTLVRSSGVSHALGLQLDNRSRIVEIG